MEKHDITFGTISGGLLTVFAIPFENILSTIVLGAIGATVSFFVTLVLKWAFRNKKNKYHDPN